MDSLQTAVNLMSKDGFMASIDWKDAYYSMNVANNFRRFLMFQWREKMFQFTCLPSGCAPRYFTKLSKVLFAQLRKQGYISTNCIDDCLLFAHTEQECGANVEETVCLSTAAGFLVHPEKSVLTPTNEITCLGFILNSEAMTVRLTKDKKEKLRMACVDILQRQTITIRQFAKVIDTLVASFPEVQYDQLFCRQCDLLKNLTLQLHGDNF